MPVSCRTAVLFAYYSISNVPALGETIVIFNFNNKFTLILTLWRYRRLALWQQHFTVFLSDSSYLIFNFWISMFISPQLRTSTAFCPKLSFLSMQVERPACDLPYLSCTWALCATWMWLFNTPILLMWMGPFSHFFRILCPSCNCPFRYSLLQNIVPVLKLPL